MDFKLVAIDMDGTLLNSNNKVSERTKDAIEKATKKGVKIILATGRILKSAINYSEELGLRKPIIACNGAIIVDEDKNIIYEKTIHKNIAGTIMDMANENNIYYHFYDRDSLYSNIYVNEIVKFYNTENSMEKESQIKVNIFENMKEVIDKNNINTYKFMIVDEDIDKLQALRNKLSQLKEINVCSSWHNNVEVMHREVSKGNSLKYLCEKLNIPREKVIAIGDNENDMTMLEYAGLGVAMENGEAVAKSVADIVTSTNDEDGVAKIIEKYILEMGDEA